MAELKPPAHLSPASKTLWAAILRDWTLSVAELAQLRMALEATDRADQARKAVEEEGMLISGRYGPKAHPGLSVERASRAQAAAILKDLGLSENVVTTSHRAPDRRLRR
jgi:hypothetical protein